MHHLIKFSRHGDLAPGILAMGHQIIQVASLYLHKSTVKNQ